MRSARPTRITDTVYQLRAIGAKVTVVASDEGVLLVDAGARGSIGRIAAGFEELEIDLDLVHTVVVTHYHPDHSGGLDRVVEATSAKVAAHALDAGIIAGEEPRPSPYRNRLLGGIASPVVTRMYGDHVGVDYRLEHEDRLAGFEQVRVVHTPGHTAGSICLHLPDQRVVIVGDALQYRFKRLGPPASSVTVDPEQAMESIERLLSLEFDTILFSHFPPLVEGAKDALRRLVQANGR